MLAKINELYFSYCDNSDDLVLENVNIDIENNSIICIQGKNGAGKTTLFRIISGILECNNMELFYKGKKMKIDEFKKKTVFIPSSPYLYNTLTGRENLELLCALWKQEKEVYMDKIQKDLEKYEMFEYLNKYVDNYSLGMKYKLYYVAMLNMNKNILIMDEPLNAMDKESQEIAIDDLKRYVTEKDRAIVFSSHITQISELLLTKELILCNKTIKKK